MSKDNVYKFRTVKWGDPEHKLKMIPDAIPAGLRPLYFALVTAGLCLASFGVIYGLRTLNVLWADLWWTHKGSNLGPLPVKGAEHSKLNGFGPW